MTFEPNGLRMVYTEGTMSLTLDIRTNSFGPIERKQIDKFLEFANTLFDFTEDDVPGAFPDDATGEK